MDTVSMLKKNIGAPKRRETPFNTKAFVVLRPAFHAFLPGSVEGGVWAVFEKHSGGLFGRLCKRCAMALGAL